MVRMIVAFAVLLLAPLGVLVFTSQALAILFTVALVGGAGLIAYTVATVARAYVRWVDHRARSRSGVMRRILVVGWLIAGAVAGAILLPAYLVHGSLNGMLDGGVSSGGAGRDVIPITGLFALAVVAFLVLVAPIVGIAYVVVSAALYWMHRTRMRIDDRPTAVGIGGLIDWLEHDARPAS